MQGHQAAHYAGTSATAAAAYCGLAGSSSRRCSVERQALRNDRRAWLAGVGPRKRALCQWLQPSDPATGAGAAADHGNDGGGEAPGVGVLRYATKLLVEVR